MRESPMDWGPLWPITLRAYTAGQIAACDFMSQHPSVFDWSLGVPWQVYFLDGSDQRE